MGFQYLADSFGFRCLGFICSWWHPRQANDGVASLPSIFSENHDYKKCFCVVVNKYVTKCIFRGLDAHGGSKLRTDTHSHTHIHTHTHGTTTVTLAVRMRAEG